MKSYLISLLMLSVMLVACSHDDGDSLTTQNVETALDFSAVVTDHTRGASINNQALTQIGRFRVWAWRQATGGDEEPMISDFNSNPLYGVDVTYSALLGRWRTAERYYWPSVDYRVDFYAACPPYDEVFDPDTKSFPDVTVSGNEDIIFATYSGQRQKGELEDVKNVPIEFKHALAQVAFSAKLSSQSPFQTTFLWTIEVGQITIHNVKSKGVFKYPKPSDNTQSYGWTPAAVYADYTLASASTGAVIVSSTTDAVALTSATDVTMLMPQTLTAWIPAWEDATNGTTITDNNNAADKGCYLDIQVRIKDQDGNYVLGASDFVHVYTPFAAIWTLNTRYRYTLIFGAGYDDQGNPFVQPVGIEATIEPWQTDNTSERTGTANHTKNTN